MIDLGSDGIIFISNKVNKENIDLYWEYYNSDGSNVEFCENVPGVLLYILKSI